MLGGALKVELVRSGFFLSANSSADSALKIPPSYIESSETRRVAKVFCQSNIPSAIISFVKLSGLVPWWLETQCGPDLVEQAEWKGCASS